MAYAGARATGRAAQAVAVLKKAPSPIPGKQACSRLWPRARRITAITAVVRCSHARPFARTIRMAYSFGQGKRCRSTRAGKRTPAAIKPAPLRFVHEEPSGTVQSRTFPMFL